MACDVTHSLSPHGSLTAASFLSCRGEKKKNKQEPRHYQRLTSPQPPRLNLRVDGEVAKRRTRHHRNLCRCTPRSLACLLPYLLLYELKQGASIHILAREVRGAAEDKGIGRRSGKERRRWRRQRPEKGRNGELQGRGNSWCLNWNVETPPFLFLFLPTCLPDDG